MIRDWRVGAATSTSITIVVRADAVETVSVLVGGNAYTGAADPDVLYGHVAIVCGGLQPGTVYDYSVGGVSGGTTRTQPATATEAWVASGSCWSESRRDDLSLRLLDQVDLDLMLFMGDAPYCATFQTRWGETPISVESSIEAGKVPENYRSHYRQFHNIPGVQDMFRAVPSRRIWDDHEVPWDNGSPNGLAHYRTYMSAPEATQEDLDIAWAAALQVAQEYTLGFNYGFDSNVTPMDTGALYGSYKIGDLVEVFVIDCIGHRSSVQAADNSSKTMLGAAQYARLVDAVNNSSATWKLIASGKQFFKSGPNTDTWNNHGDNPGFETEKAALLLALKDVTGLLVVAGDQHLWADQWVSAGDLGANMPAISCLVGCPTSVNNNANSVAGYETGVRTKQNGYPFALEVKQENVIALFRFTPTRCYRYLETTLRGRVPCGYIDAGSNQVQYPRDRIG